MNEPRPPKMDVHGWIVLDKPVGMTSTQGVAVVKRLLRAKKAGHAGTLDPLASGLLPIALGEATKTVPFVMDGRKIYRFTVRWGAETDTDDTEGSVIATSHARPARARTSGSRRARSRFIHSGSSRPHRTRRPSRPNAGRGPMSARWPGISGATSAATGTSWRFGAPPWDPSTSGMPSRPTS
jgi:hypothetical protein